MPPARKVARTVADATAKRQAKQSGTTIRTAAVKPLSGSEFAGKNTVASTSGGTAEELFEKAIEEGNDARDQRRYTIAEAAYKRAQKLKATDSRSIYGLGNLFGDQQRWEEAEKAYRAAIKLEPDSPEAHLALSFVLTQPVIGVNPMERYAEAERFARRAIELDPKKAAAYDQLGVSLELRGHIENETLNAYRKAISIDLEFAPAYAHLGRLLSRKGLEVESLKAYADSIRLATDVPTQILVAEVMQSQQRYKESEQLLRKALKTDPKNPTALFLLGRALVVRQEYPEAEKFLKTGIDVSPNSFVSYALLGSLYARRNKFDEAERILLRAVRVISENEKRRLSKEFEFVGDKMVQSGRKKDAERVFRKAFELDGESQTLRQKVSADAN